jgi:non-ribosomal peptide synthetase component E (peptide arylation enzyme)
MLLIHFTENIVQNPLKICFAGQHRQHLEVLLFYLFPLAKTGKLFFSYFTASYYPVSRQSERCTTIVVFVSYLRLLYNETRLFVCSHSRKSRKEPCKMAKPSRFTPELEKEYVEKGYWNKTTLADVWDQNAQKYPDDEAVVDSKTRLTWAQAKLWIDRLALGFLELGFKKDDLLVLQLQNSVELTLLRVAAEKAGLLCLPVLRTLRHAEMEYILKYAEAVGIVILWEFRGFNYIDMLREIRPRLPKSLKYIFVAGDKVPEEAISIKEMVAKPLEKKYPPDYLQDKKMPWNEFSIVAHTSGSTGFPKFVEYPIASTMRLGIDTVEAYNLTHSDIVAALSPAAFGPSVIAHVCAPIAGAKIVMEEHFEPEEALQIIEREKVTAIGVVPTQLTMMTSHPNFSKYDISSLRLIRCTGAPLAYHVGVNVEEKMKAKIVQCYGAVDFSTICGSAFTDSQEVRLLTTGRPYIGGEVKLMDDSGKEVPLGEVGEVWARGPHGVSGYFKDPETTKKIWEGGWYRTGDLGKFRPDGTLMVVGRKKDMIIRGGQNIYPAEIEALLLTHPRVAMAAVVGMPDELMGERACAFIVPKKGQSMTTEEMTSFLKTKGIAPFKIPERLEVVDRLPWVADGQKVDKKVLAKQIAEKVAAERKAKDASSPD